jgi:quercetin dioxygenase-like cupin family protein
MEIASLFADLEYGEKHPVTQILVNTSVVKEVRITFKKGQVMKAHKASYPIVVEIVDGCVDFGLETENYILKKGMLIVLEASVMHELKAEQDSIVRLSLVSAIGHDFKRQLF